MFIGSPPICNNSTLMGLLNSSVGGLGNQESTSVDLIWGKAKWTSLLVCLHFLIIHFTNFLHASTCPLLLSWFDDVMTWSMFRCLQNSCKICAYIWNQYFGLAKLSEYRFACLNQVFGQHALHHLHKWELTVGIYNAHQISLLIKKIFAKYLPQPGWHLMGVVFPCSCIFWYSRQVNQCFTAFSIPAFIFILYMDSHTCNLIFSIPMLVLNSWLNICICNGEGIINCLPFMAMQSIMANSGLMGQ